jgi:hypothetical protein
MELPRTENNGNGASETNENGPLAVFCSVYIEDRSEVSDIYEERGKAAVSDIRHMRKGGFRDMQGRLPDMKKGSFRDQLKHRKAASEIS